MSRQTQSSLALLVVAVLAMSALVSADYDEYHKCPVHIIHKTNTVKVPYPVVKKIPEVKVIKMPYKVPVKEPVYIPIKEEKYEHKSYGHDSYKA